MLVDHVHAYKLINIMTLEVPGHLPLWGFPEQTGKKLR